MAEGVEITRELNRNFILADSFQFLARQGNSIPLFLRYQAQLERLYRRAVEESERVRKLRPESKRNEPISSPPIRPGGAGDLGAGALKDPRGVGASAPPPFPGGV